MSGQKSFPDLKNRIILFKFIEDFVWVSLWAIKNWKKTIFLDLTVVCYIAGYVCVSVFVHFMKSRSFVTR